MYLFFPVAVYAIFVYLLRKSQAGWRDSTLCGAAIWGFALFVITELLSISKHLSLWPVVISWALIGAGVYLASKWGLALDGDFRSEQISAENNPCDPMGFVWPAILVFFFLAITCLVAAPNTSDAMRYHMPRVVYWFEYKSIAHYAAVEYCQLQMPPFAEFAMLHAFILAKGDRFVGFIQFFGFLGSAVAGSVIAKSLGGSRYVQAFAALLCSLLPVAVLESSGAKNDCFTSFWLMLVLYGGLRFGQKCNMFWAVISAISMGLSILTKGTCIIYSPVFFATGLCCSGFNPKRSIRFVPVFIAFIFFINAPHWIRNYEFSGSPLGFASATNTGKDFTFQNEDLSPAGILSNVLRNSALHVSTPVSQVNRYIETLFRFLIRKLGRDPNDPVALWTGTTFAINDPSLHESVAPNPQHFGLFAACLGLLIYFRAWRTHRSWVIYGLGVAVSFVAFSALLRWQPWHTRLHMPFFLAACPLIALVLEHYAPKTVKAIALFLFMMASPLVLTNGLRPLLFAGNIFDVPRIDRYFQEHANLRSSYQQLAENFETGFCNDVGVDSSLNFLEYPMLALLKPGEGKIKLRQMSSTPFTERLGPANPVPPCAIICLGCAGVLTKMEAYKDYSSKVRVYGESVLFSKKALFGCDVSFVSGWYNREVFSGDKWIYWTQKEGTIQIYSDKAQIISIAGEATSVVRPNSFEVTISDHKVYSHLPLENFSFNVSVPEGQSTVTFKSELPGSATRKDARPLALGLWNVSFKVAGSTRSCLLHF